MNDASRSSAQAPAGRAIALLDAALGTYNTDACPATEQAFDEAKAKVGR